MSRIFTFAPAVHSTPDYVDLSALRSVTCKTFTFYKRTCFAQQLFLSYYNIKDYYINVQTSHEDIITEKSNHMWSREWMCTCPENTSTEFINHLNNTGVKDTQSIEGCCGYKIFKRVVPGYLEITLHTFWETKGKMKSYAGEYIYNAALYPEHHVFKIIPELEVRAYGIIASHTNYT